MHGDSVPLQVRLIDYLERAHSFVEAAETNRGFLASPSEFPVGPGLFPSGSNRSGEDAHEPLSWGTDRLQAVSIAVGPPPGGAGAGLVDLSFIPTFRDVAGVTGIDRWCREWSLRRDLVLAGRPQEALLGFPARFFERAPSSVPVLGYDMPDSKCVLHGHATPGRRRGV